MNEGTTAQVTICCACCGADHELVTALGEEMDISDPICCEDCF